MTQTAKLFIRQDTVTGDVILPRKPPDWDGFLEAVADGAVPADFLDGAERVQGAQDRDPLTGWRE